MPRANPNSLLERPPPCRLAPVAEPVWGAFPRPLASFLDRTVEIAPVQDPLRDPGQRLIALHGPGGGGKPRRAIAASAALDDAFPDGAAFRNRTAATSPDHAVGRITARGVRGQAGLTIAQSLVAAILATSREPLRMQQAQHAAVAPFAGPAGGERSRETALNLRLARRDVEVVRLLNAGQADREGVSSRSEAAAQGMKLGLDCGGRRATR